MKKKHYGDGYQCYVRVFDNYNHEIHDATHSFHSIRAALRYVKKYYPDSKWRIRSRYVGIPDVRNF